MVEDRKGAGIMKQYTAEELEYLGCSTQHIINLVQGRTMRIMSEKILQLPEGYQEDEDGSLIDPKGNLTAWLRKDGMLAVAAWPWDFPALTIWLQRRAR